MRIRHRTAEPDEASHLQMSSMIDVVFLLLIFFVMTFQITAAEGDIAITPEQAAASSKPMLRRETLRVHLIADDAGMLRGVQLEGRMLSRLNELNAVICEMVAVRSAEEFSVQLSSDASLQYQATVGAITAIRIGPGGESLIQDVRLTSQP